MFPTSLPGGNPAGMTAARPTSPRAASRARFGIAAALNGVSPSSSSSGSSAHPSGTSTTYFTRSWYVASGADLPVAARRRSVVLHAPLAVGVVDDVIDAGEEARGSPGQLVRRPRTPGGAAGVSGARERGPALTQPRTEGFGGRVGADRGAPALTIEGAERERQIHG